MKINKNKKNNSKIDEIINKIFLQKYTWNFKFKINNNKNKI